MHYVRRFATRQLAMVFAGYTLAMKRLRERSVARRAVPAAAPKSRALAEVLRISAMYSPVKILTIWQEEHPIGSAEAQRLEALGKSGAPFQLGNLPGECFVRALHPQVDQGRVVFSLERREG